MAQARNRSQQLAVGYAPSAHTRTSADIGPDGGCPSSPRSNLIKAGYKVVVYNRNAEKCAPLVKLGAEMASSPQQVAEKASSTFVMVSDPDAAKEVAFGKVRRGPVARRAA